MEEQTFDDDNIITSESANYSPKAEFSKPRIVEEGLKICINKRGKEMIKGYWNTRMTKDGTPIKTWIPDARKEFISSVKALFDLLRPEIISGIKYDKKIEKDQFYFKKRFDAIKEREEKLFKEYSYQEQELITGPKGYQWVKTDKRYIPDVDDLIILPDIKNSKMGKSVLGFWNQKVNLYWNEMLILYDEIFSELNCLIHDLDYFKPKLNWG